MKRIFLLSFLFFSVSTLSAQSYILFGAKEKYFLSKLEANLALDSIVVNNYDKYNFSLQHQVPLQKYVNSPDYNLYIGLALDDSPSDMMSFYLNYAQYEILLADTLKIKRKTIYKIFIKDKDKYLYKVIFKTKKTVYSAVLTYTSFDKNIIQNLYSDELFFENKFGKKYKIKNK